MLALALVIMAFSGCKKSTDNAAAWVGTYTSTSGGGISNTFNQVVIQENNSFTLRVLYNIASTGSNAVTYATLQHLTLQNAMAGTISESDSVLGFHGVYQFTGTVSLNSDTLKIICTATDSSSLPFSFYGVKQ